MKNTIYIIFISLTFYYCSQKKDWKKISLNTQEHLHDIEVINNSTALAYSYGTGKLFKTINSGNEWKQIHQFDSIYFEQIQFLNPQTGWICGTPNSLLKTVDGGNNWKDISIKETEGSAIYGMYFKDANTGYISVISREKSVTASKIYQTNDGGINWSYIHSIPSMILNLEEIGNTIYGSGNNIIIKDIHKKDNWKISYKDTAKLVGQIRDLAIDKNGNIKAASFNGYVLSLEKKKWSVKQLSKNRFRSISSISNEGWIVVGDSIKELYHVFKSIDNGENWFPIQEGFPDIHRTKIFNNKLWMVGKKGFIAKKEY